MSSGPTQQERLFSQQDPRVVQRPPGVDGEGIKDAKPGQRELEQYAPARATPGRSDENHMATNATAFSAAGKTLVLDKDLGFPAHSVMIDNFSNQWLEFEGFHRFIPPYSFGWVINSHQGAQQGRVALNKPAPAYTQPAVIAGEYVWALFTEAMLPPATGIVKAPP